ncbi:hypothetical protein [Lysinibacillus xylanilyticus]
MEQQGTDKTNFLKTCEDCGKKFDISEVSHYGRLGNYYFCDECDTIMGGD